MGVTLRSIVIGLILIPLNCFWVVIAEIMWYSGEPTTISFADFRGAPNSRVQSFSYFYSEAEDRFAPDLALLVSLIADGSLKPQIGVERSWRDIAQVAGQLRDRQVAGKAVLLVDAG